MDLNHHISQTLDRRELILACTTYYQGEKSKETDLKVKCEWHSLKSLNLENSGLGCYRPIVDFYVDQHYLPLWKNMT